MNISSAQPTYSITSSNSIDTISITGNTIDTSSITLSGSSYTSNTVTIGGSGSYTIGPIVGTVTLNDINSSDNYTFNLPVEWKDCFPMWTRIQDMCEQYPGLKIAFDKFKTTYELVKDDYDAPKDKK